MNDFYIFKKNEYKTILEFLFNNNFNIVDNILNANYLIAFGGDGTLIDAFEFINNQNIDIPIIPIRNSNLCLTHNLNFYKEALLKNSLVKTKHSILVGNIDAINASAISEITIKNENIAQAIRFDVYINNQLYANNIIGDGVLICTSLGSTGYFKSVSNTIFKNGIGIGFINSTQHINHLVLSENDIIKIKIKRGNAILAFDKFIPKNYLMKDNSELIISNGKKLTLFGYNNFMCQQCRNLRHFAYVNDIFNTL